jgi:hypothetical protein
MSSEDSGLLGNLPKTRPGVESPRRAAARKRAAEKPSPPPAAEPADDGGSGFEQLARAGAGLAAGSAAVGFRLAGRALGGLGKAVGRR